MLELITECHSLQMALRLLSLPTGARAAISIEKLNIEEEHKDAIRRVIDLFTKHQPHAASLRQRFLNNWKHLEESDLPLAIYRAMTLPDVGRLAITYNNASGLSRIRMEVVEDYCS